MNALRDILDPLGLALLALAGLAIAALANGFETGLYRVNRVRLRIRATQGEHRAIRLRMLLRDLRGMIIVCLIAANVGGYLATVVGTTFVARCGWFDSHLGVEILSMVILTPLLLIFADVVPKSLFAVEADRWVFPLVEPVRWVYRTLRGIGLLAALKGISTLVLRIAGKQQVEGSDPFTPRERLRAIIREGLAEGVISGYQHELAEKVLGLHEQPVGAVMIPLRHVAAVPVTITRQRFIEELRRNSYTRLPVYENHKSNIVGIVRVDDVLAQQDGEFDLRGIMSRNLVVVPPTMPISQVMARMRRSRAVMAVVADPKGQAIGIITIKDLVEEVLGELAPR